MPYKHVPTDPDYAASRDLNPPRDREYERNHMRIEKHYHANGNGKAANDRLYTIITGTAALLIALVLSILSYQIQRVLDKVEDHAERITRLEERAKK